MATRDIYESGFDEDVPTEQISACPECDGRIQTNTVETVCENCGLIVTEQRIDHSPEWRTFESDPHGESPKRTGASLTVRRHDRGLSTKIGHRIDANGNELPSKKRGQLGRLRREHSRGQFRSKGERNLAHGLSEVQRITSVLDLTESVGDQACQLFRSAKTENLLQGRSIEAIAAASVYGACRCNGISRLLEEVVEPARVEKSRVKNAYRVLNEELGLPAEPVSVSAFIPRLASELDCSDDIRKRADALAKQAERAGVTVGVHPSGFAAACLYKASREHRGCLRQTDVADVADVSIATVRSHRYTLDELLS